MLIGQLADMAGVKSDSVRFYERSGLLPKPERLVSGYRVYDETSLKRLQFIKQAQVLGFSLDEIRRILNLQGRGKETCRCVINIAETTLHETEIKIKHLEIFRKRLKKNLDRWKQLFESNKMNAGFCSGEFCSLIQSTQLVLTEANSMRRNPK